MKKQKAETLENDEQNSSTERSEGDWQEDLEYNEPNDQQENFLNDDAVKKPKSPKKNRANSKNKGLFGKAIAGLAPKRANNASGKEKQPGKSKNRK